MAEPGKPASTTRSAPVPERFAFTLDTSTGEIIKIENVESADYRRELPKTDRLDLAKKRLGIGVEGLLERAFEAGLAKSAGLRR